MIGSADRVEGDHGVPFGVLAGARVVRDVPVDAMLTYDDVELDESAALVRIRRIQDDMLRDDVAAPSLRQLHRPPGRLRGSRQGNLTILGDDH